MDMFTKAKRKEIMSRIQGKNTIPEKLVRSRLHSLGYRFTLHNTKLPCKPDIVMQKYKTIILINGCFWHQHSNCRLAKIPKTRTKFWRNKLQQNIIRQRKNIKALRKMGYNIVTVWECQTYRNLDKVIKKIDKRLKTLG